MHPFALELARQHHDDLRRSVRRRGPARPRRLFPPRSSRRARPRP